MQGTSLTKQERECKLYYEFDKFAYKKGETLRDLYLRFSLLLNDLNIYNVKLEQFQPNTKFLNYVPPEWRKFMNDVKLVQDLHTTNIDQLYAYLEQHEFHANAICLMHEHNSDPLALYSTNQPSTPLSLTYPSNDYHSTVHHNIYSPQPSIPQLEYIPTVIQQQPEFPSLDLGLNVPVFKHGDDPIDAINHIMSFLTSVVTSRYLTTNNQLRNSSNPRQQGTTRTYTPGASRSHSGKQMTVICYNYKEEEHMSKQCTKPKRKRDNSWFKDKVLLVQAQADGQILHEEELAFLADPIISKGQATQTVITHNATYQAEDLDAYDSNCDELNIAKVALMANLPQYGLDVLAETKITSDSNIIPYSQYVEETQQKAVQNSSSSTQQDALILSVIEQLKTQLELKLYDGNVIKNTCVIVIPDYEETLMLAEESHSKMILKQQNPMVLEKMVNTTPVDYAIMIPDSEETLMLKKRFVPQTELSAEQDFLF
nr:hypothetical protein [Tanacetum cinerariifolium]